MNRPLLLSGLLFLALVSSGQPEDYLSHFTEYEINSANTAKNVDYLIQSEKDIYLYNNLARMYPKKFYNLYKEFATQTPNEVEMFQTEYYYTSLTKDLLNRPPAGPLLPDRVMFELAECWALESGEKGIVGHDRITCEGGFFAENCSYGHSEGLDIVMQLLIDHSVESLGHRKNMLDGRHKGLGVAVRAHRGYGFCAVQDFTHTNDVLRAQDEVKKREAEVRQKEAEALQKEIDKKLEMRAAEFDTAMSKWTSEEKSSADVCRNLMYLNNLEKDFYFFANLMRLYPKKFKEVLWDKGPYFDQLLVDIQAEFHQTAGYKSITNYLNNARPGPALIPNEITVRKGRCVIESWARGSSNVGNCLKGSGSWQIQSYFEEDDYHDITMFLMDTKTFNALFNQQTTILLENGMKAMIR